MNTNHVVKLMLPLEVADAIAISPEAVPAGSEVEPAHKLHVTLAFLGKRADVSAVSAACQDAADHLTKSRGELLVVLSGLHAFKFKTRDVVYAAVHQELATGRYSLRALCAGLVASLAARGVKVDDTYDAAGWTPHVTLARVPPGTRVEPRGLPITAKIRAITYKAGEEVHVYDFRG